MSEHGSTQTAPPPPAPATPIEHAMLVSVPIVLGLTAMGFVELARSATAWQLASLIVALPMAWAMADLLTGLTHWALDTYGSATTPVIGPTVIQPFRMHHEHPTYMVQFSDAATVALSATAVAPLQGGLYLMSTLGGWWAVAASVLMVTLLGAVGTNLFHKWAHMERPPWIGRVLQRARLILPARHHDRHHRAPHDCSYCITCGWLNPGLDRIDLWRRLERGLARLGVEPNV